MLCALVIATGSAWAQNPPPRLLLAGEYRPDAQPGLHLPDYWVSEKLDGVRARWDGRQLVSRGGRRIHAPAWFTQGWPDQTLDGELWGGRGRFEDTAGTVARITPEDSAWRRLRFMVFDLPGHDGTFTERVAAMAVLREDLRGMPSSAWLQIVEQSRAGTQAELDRRLDATVRAGGEGLMLHRGEARYRAGRSDDLLKVKPFQDAEAQVLSHLPGRGRHAGRMGALLVQTPDGRRFRLGTGFSDAQRMHPPPPGSWVSYRYRGLTADGLPRFATFLRVRSDAELTWPASDEAARR
jgi:DNA ligase-1